MNDHNVRQPKGGTHDRVRNRGLKGSSSSKSKYWYWPPSTRHDDEPRHQTATAKHRQPLPSTTTKTTTTATTASKVIETTNAETTIGSHYRYSKSSKSSKGKSAKSSTSVSSKSNKSPIYHPPVPVVEENDGSSSSSDDDPPQHLISYQMHDPMAFYKYGMDPTIFHWLNIHEIQPGGTTCGFLFPPLGSRGGIVYPKIRVYICMKFATHQPARKGNMAIHCGGPGAVSDCLLVLATNTTVGEKNLEDYNFISIDQRGMGRSWPSFAHVECTFGMERNETTGELQSTQNTVIESLAFDPSNTTFLSDFAELNKQRNLGCWACQKCGFHMSSIQMDGSTRKFHFLEYSGTRQVAEDLNRFRQAIKSGKLSLYGVSYGTQVMSTYATMFPESVGNFVLDSPVSPGTNLLDIVTDKAVGYEKRVEYLIASCDIRRVLGETGGQTCPTDANGESVCVCPVEDIFGCLNGLKDLFTQLGGSVGEFVETQAAFVNLMFSNPSKAKELCDAASDVDFEAILDIIFGSLFDDLLRRRLQAEGMSGSKSQPTLSWEPVVDNPDYWAIANDVSSPPVAIVWAEDTYGGTFDEKFYIDRVIEFNNRYTYGNLLSSFLFLTQYAYGYYWPNSTPLPPRGNSQLMGIVSGQIFDSNTPYKWAQEMRLNFKETSFLQSQWTSHGLDTHVSDPGDPSCQKYISDYFETGLISFHDGTVCGSPFGSVCDMLTALGAAPEGSCEVPFMQ